MSCYNLMRKSDRVRLRADRQAELDAIEAGAWPRDINDSMRWSVPEAPYARRMVEHELCYLDDLDQRAFTMEGWEA